MNFNEYLKITKEIQDRLQGYFEVNEKNETLNIIVNTKFHEDRYELISLFELKVSNHHHRDDNFNHKIEELLHNCFILYSSTISTIFHRLM